MTKERKGQISNRGQKETTDRVGASSSKTNPSRARKTLRSEVWTKPRRSVLPETDAAKTFEWLAREYLKTQTRRLSPESLNRVRKIIQANLITFFGCKDSVDTFTPADVARYISDRIKVVSAASAAKELGVLKSVFQHAVDSNLIDSNPASLIPRPKIADRRQFRCLTEDEVSSLLNSSPDWLRVIIRFTLLTGLRRSELTGLRWSDINADHLHIQNAPKLNRQSSVRRIPLSGPANDILRSIRPDRWEPGEFVFPKPPATEANISLQFLRASRKAGFEGLSYQQLRHTTIAWMRGAGIDVETISAYMGHSSLRSTLRYLEPEATGLKTAIDLVGRTLAGLPKFTHKRHSPARSD